MIDAPAAKEGEPEADRDFSIRLLGTGLTSFLQGFEKRGRLISEMEHSRIGSIMQLSLGHVTAARRPARRFVNPPAVTGLEYQQSETCFAPLSDDDANINIIIAMTSVGHHAEDD